MRESAFRGTWAPNLRPYVTLTPDAYVSIQGQTSIIGCGECLREVNYNRYITQISTEASVDSPPGSATFTLSIPDNDVNDFYAEGQFVIIPMMEVEIYAKGYFTVGGLPQYYKIFWGLVSSVTKSWSNGTTTVQVQCKDILRWWELTNTVINPAFLNSFGSSAGGYQLFQNQYAGLNPYTIIIQLAKEAMGDFSATTGSLNDTFTPETGPEGPVIASYAKDIMAYWQLKFSNIWNSLVLYGSSGQAYTFTGSGGTVSGAAIEAAIAKNEDSQNKSLGEAVGSTSDGAVKVRTETLSAFKTELARAGDVEFFQNETQSKLSVAMTCRDQAGFEFYCDTTGDIIFKPPFYNLNVMPNKPVSWIQDYEIIDDSVTDSEAEVYTHITSSGIAFGGPGAFDPGLSDEITTPRTGAYDFHLLRRYGWRRLDYQCEWATSARQLFFHLIDYLDRVNAKRQNGTVTIPMRPELRMGFPIWFPKYDSFFYIQGISHQYAVGGQATTTLTLIAKRSKFIAPDNIGTIAQVSVEADPTTSETAKTKATDPSKATKPPKPRKVYSITFPGASGDTSGIAQPTQHSRQGKPLILRDPSTGKLLGYPNVVMVYQKPFDGDLLAKVNTELENAAKGATAVKAAATTRGSSATAASPAKKDSKKEAFSYDNVIAGVLRGLEGEQRGLVIKRLRARRYEAGMSNAGAYDYAHDVGAYFQELALVPLGNISWGTGTSDPTIPAGSTVTSADYQKKVQDGLDTKTKDLDGQIKVQQTDVDAKQSILSVAKKAYSDAIAKAFKGATSVPADKEIPPEVADVKSQLDAAQTAYDTSAATLGDLVSQQKFFQSLKAGLKTVGKMNMLVRPVSDEFGFELIGHYRYGRGTFIDRGMMKTPAPDGTSANKINVQFAATGGLLADPTQAGGSGPKMPSFAASFEDMRPDDYLTGASIQGSDPSNVTYTDVNTYNSAVANSQSRTGKVVFADADATRRGVTMAELKPTIQIDGLSGAFEKCGCQLSKPSWLSVLPQSLISQVLKPVSMTEDPSSGGTSVSNAEGFFDTLNKYLIDRFRQSSQKNSSREIDDVGANVGAYNPDNDVEDNNILGDPGDPLFSRAANGDASALEALKQAANFNFGQTSLAAKQASNSVSTAVDAAGTALSSFPGQFGNALTHVVGATTDTPAQQAAASAQADLAQASQQLQQAEQFAQANPNSPVAQQALADARSAYAKAQSANTAAQNPSSNDAAASAARQQAISAYNAQITAYQKQADVLSSQIQAIENRDSLLSLTDPDKAADDAPILASLKRQLAQIQGKIADIQAALQAAQQAPDNVTPTPQFQILPPTQGSVLNLDLKKFTLNYGAARNGFVFNDPPQ